MISVLSKLPLLRIKEEGEFFCRQVKKDKAKAKQHPPHSPVKHVFAKVFAR
jgi:hypothetical protein